MLCLVILQLTTLKMSRRQQRISRHLKQQLPQLLRQARATLQPSERWEADAVMTLRATIQPRDANYIQQTILQLLSEYQAAIPSLMSMDPVPSRDYTKVIKKWYVHADRRSSTQTPPLDTMSAETDEGNVCPVCLMEETNTTTHCGHRFCDECLDICARARPTEALLCPLCRTPLKAPLELPELEEQYDTFVDPPPGFTAVTHVTPSTHYSRGRPRVNEFWLSEDELSIYLGYYVPILGS